MIHFIYPSSKGGGTFCGAPLEANGSDVLCEDCVKIDNDMLPTSGEPVEVKVAKPKRKGKAKS